MLDDDDDAALVHLDVRQWAQRVMRRRFGDSTSPPRIGSAKRDMELFEIAMYDVLHIGRTGNVEGDPQRTESGEIKCRCTQTIRNQRAYVDFAIYGDDELVIIGVGWEKQQ